MLTSALLLAASLAWQPPAPAPAGCEVNYDTMMALNPHAFDQDLQGGWRPLARRDECRETAAELLRLYRQTHEPTVRLLTWHEAQVRADLGQIDAAIALMEASRKRENDHWNPYVDATIAFLRNDRNALLAARERLVAVPPPADFAAWRDTAGRPIRWPLNLDVVDGFIRCFGRPYKEAYGSDSCRMPNGR